MITDVLFKRYPNQWLMADSIPHALALVLRQAALVLSEDVMPSIPDRERIYESAHRRLARELGGTHLAQGRSHEERCIKFLMEIYDLWNDDHGSPDDFFKLRLSLVELLFQEAENRLQKDFPSGDLKQWQSIFRKRVSPTTNDAAEKALESLLQGIYEINERFHEAKLPFEFHNGLIQTLDDPLTSQEIEGPFWGLVADTKWRNVDQDIKEAIDRRDSGKGDAAFFALKALESAIKIISDDLQLTRGTERGAAHYIDNLVSEKNGRFIEVWEAEFLKLLFRDVRNALGHGPGSASPLTLSAHQSTFVIEAAMALIKSLVRRTSKI